MTKAPTPTDLSKGQSDNINNVTIKFDYTAVADRLRTVSWSNCGHQTGVVNMVYGPNLPTPRNSRVIKMPGIRITKHTFWVKAYCMRLKLMVRVDIQCNLSKALTKNKWYYHI